MKSLFDILAYPRCRVGLKVHTTECACPECGPVGSEVPPLSEPRPERSPATPETGFPAENEWSRAWRLGWVVLRNEGFRIFLGKLFRSWSRKLLY